MRTRPGRRLVLSAVAVCALVVSGAGSASAAKSMFSGERAVSSTKAAVAAASAGLGAGFEAALPANAGAKRQLQGAV